MKNMYKIALLAVCALGLNGTASAYSKPVRFAAGGALVAGLLGTGYFGKKAYRAYKNLAAARLAVVQNPENKDLQVARDVAATHFLISLGVSGLSVLIGLLGFYGVRYQEDAPASTVVGNKPSADRLPVADAIVSLGVNDASWGANDQAVVIAHDNTGAMSPAPLAPSADQIQVLASTPAAPVVVVMSEDAKNLVKLCHKGDLAGVKALAARPDVDFNISGSSGNTPFLVACMGGHLELAQWLAMQPGVKIDIVNEHGKNAFFIVCERKAWPLATWLVEEKGFDVNTCDAEGDTVLIEICRNHKLADLEQFAKFEGIDACVANNKGETALQVARRRAGSIRDQERIARIVIKLMLRQNKGLTDEQLRACLSGNLGLFADSFSRRVEEEVFRNPTLLFQRAIVHGYTELAQWLVARGGVDVNAPYGKDGRTLLLYLSCCPDSYDIACSMLESIPGIDVTLTDSEGRTAAGIVRMVGARNPAEAGRLLAAIEAKLQSKSEAASETYFP